MTRPRADRGARSELNALFFEMESAGDAADGTNRLLVCGSELLQRGDDQAPAGLGAAPCRARTRFAGRFAHPARGRLQLRPKRESRAARAGRATLVARGADRL